MTKGLVIYHGADMDGIVSGMLAKIDMLNNGITDVEMMPVKYSNMVNNIYVGGYDAITLTDFSFNEQLMIKLASHGNFKWYDHHQYAIDAFNKLDVEFEPAGVRDGSECAAMLIYKDLFQSKSMGDALDGKYITILHEFDTPVSYFMKLVNVYDLQLRDSPLYEQAMMFNYALSSIDEDGLFKDLDRLLANGNAYASFGFTSGLLRHGEYIRNYQLKELSKLKPARLRIRGNDEQIEHIPLYFKYSNELLYMHTDNAIAMLTINDEGKALVSLRSKNANIFNACDAAKAHGGGGHACAAGFSGDVNTILGMVRYNEQTD